MTIDDPSLLVNILGRDLRSVTKERDELLQKLKQYEEAANTVPPPTPELETENGVLRRRIVELETELKLARETAFDRLSENMEMRNRRARIKRDLQNVTARVTELESAQLDSETRHLQRVKSLEDTVAQLKEELLAERRKNAGLKDLIVKVTGQRDDALLKLAGIRRISTVQPVHVDVEARCLSAEVKPLSINKHLELSDALETPYSTFDANAPGPGTFISLSEYPMSDTSATTPRTSTDSDIPDFKTRVKRLNSLRNLPTIDVPPETIHAICAVGETSILDRHLKQLAQSKIFNLPFFIGESDIEFANPTRQHGYVLRPTLALEPVHNRWSPYTIDTFEPEFPNIFELFVASLRGWYYRGTYRRIEPGMLELPNLSIGEYSDLTTFSKTTLQEQVLRLVDDEEGSGNPADPFLSGEVAVQCIGLQCVGFNTELYRSLVALQPPDSRQDFMSELSHGSSTGTSSFDIDTPIKSPTDSENNRSSISSTASMLIRRLSKTLGHKRIRSNAGSDGTFGSGDEDGLPRRVKQLRTSKLP